MRIDMKDFIKGYNNTQTVVETKSQVLEVSYTSLLDVVWDIISVFVVLEGIKLSKDITNKHKDLLDLYIQLSDWAYDQMAKRATREPFKATFSRTYIELIIEALATRLTHCEKERDNGDKKFNVDTYIHMKLMYLDLRDALAYRSV